MKKRICFTGFPGEEVAALQAVTQTQALWECRFVPDAEAALAWLAGEPCDVCVASMAMPGINGAQLLCEAGRRHPQTLGIIVGDLADQALIIDSLGHPHQFVRRPYTLASLMAVVQAGLKLEAWLPSAELRQLRSRLRWLPSLSATYFNLVREMESPASTVLDIGEVIRRDPVITGQLLQMANSPALSLAQEVTQPAEAVSLLGLQTVKALVLCLPVFGQGEAAREAGLSLETLWEHSLLVAQYARFITLKQGGDARLAEDAFTAGLLHDVGRLVIASNWPKEYAAAVACAREKSCPLHEAEAAQLGVDHAKAGACLLSLWGLPAPFVEAAAGHHAPAKTTFAREFTLLTAVHAANVFAHANSGPGDGLPLPELDLAYYRALKLEEQLVGWRLECTGGLSMAPQSQLVLESIAIPVATPPPRPPEPEPAQSHASLWKLIVAGLLVAAGVWAWPFLKLPTWSAVHLAPASGPPAATAPAPAPAASNLNWAFPTGATSTKAAPGPVTLETVKVQGIFYRSAKSMVIINDQALSVGDNLQGIYVVAIRQSSVTLSNNGVLKTCSITDIRGAR